MLILYYILFAIKCKKTSRNSAGFRKIFIGSLTEGAVERSETEGVYSFRHGALRRATFLREEGNYNVSRSLTVRSICSQTA